RGFECRIDDLFHFIDDPARTPVWAWTPAREPCRFWQSEVYGRNLLFPAETASPWSPPHDGLSEFGVLQFRRQIPPSQTLVLACCDPAAGLLSAEYARTTDYRLLVVPRSSGAALDLLAEKRVHLAGVHLHGSGGEDGNAQAVRARLGTGYSLLHVARWQAGLVIGNGAAVRSVESALRGKLRWVGREPGSGARQCLDELRGRRRSPDLVARDHRGVAEAVRAGWADVGVCVRLVGDEAGLRFFEVRDECYDLCCPADSLSDPRVEALHNVLRSESYRGLLAELPGYDSSDTGVVNHVA
ncbi:MAG: XRE family transcriptional regulator, partial [Planctomycetaceae bacterium]